MLCIKSKPASCLLQGGGIGVADLGGENRANVLFAKASSLNEGRCAIEAGTTGTILWRQKNL